MSYPQDSQCLRCKWYQGLLTCKAYLEQIPHEIASNDHDHREPYPGDGGIRFEPLKKDEDEEQAD